MGMPWGVSKRIREMSLDVLEVNQGSLYPALHRLEDRGMIVSEWKVSDEGRRAFLFSLLALANGVAVADRLPLGDPESVPGAMEKGAKTASRGMVEIARRRNHLQDRLGGNRISRPGRHAGQNGHIRANRQYGARYNPLLRWPRTVQYL